MNKSITEDQKRKNGRWELRTEAALCIENLTVARGNETIIREINLQVHSGEMLVLVGPNGSGKTTLLKALIGDIPYKGTVRYTNDEGKNVRPRVGYVPQKLEFDPESPVSVLDLFASSFARIPVWLGYSAKLQRKVKNDLTRVGGEHLLHSPLGQLSGGELQRVLLALALDPLPEVLLLDEPFSAVDQNSLEKFYALVAGLIRQYKMTALLVSHDIDLAARFAQQMVFIDHSIQAMGTPEEVLDHEAFHRAFSQYNIPNKRSVGNLEPC
jgi:zinc transport system ATP-binding protein